MSNFFLKIHHYYSVLGFRGVLMFCIAKATRAKLIYKKTIAGIKTPIFVRLGTTDVSVLKQVLIERQYDYLPQKSPKVIVDAGANIGLASVFFANRYPDAMIIALEPEACNFQLLKQNTAAYPQIRAIEAALWSETRDLLLIDPGAGDHGYQTQTSSSGNLQTIIKALTIHNIMTEAGINFIDILKIDIEGSEKEVFEHSESWVKHIGVIMAELHENLKPGCTAAFTTATFDFSVMPAKGETIIRVNRQISSI